MAKVLVEENATTAIDQADYRTRYESLEKRYQAEQANLDGLLLERNRKVAQKSAIEVFIKSYGKIDIHAVMVAGCGIILLTLIKSKKFIYY